MNDLLFEKLKKFFWARVTPVPGDACWEWQSGMSVKPRKYGNISIYGGPEIGIKTFLAHRASWLIHYGSIADRMFVCHHCDNPKCVRPDHLFLGTQSDNIKDSIAKGRFTQLGTHLPDRRSITHCPHGHPYDDANTGISVNADGSSHRYCRSCHRVRAAERRKERKLACSA